MVLKFFIIAGEDSGDVLGANLIKALKVRFPECEITGIGGREMLMAGLDRSLFPIQRLSAMGIVEILPRIPEFLKLIKQTVCAVEQFQPHAVITIDSPDFCLRVQKSLKNRKNLAKLIHYVAPTVWAWRPGRAKKIAQFLDGLICLFPFEPAYFTTEGLPAIFAGHPIVNSGIIEAKPDEFLEKYRIKLEKKPKTIGFFCGSRVGELDFSIPLYREIWSRISAEFSDIIAIIPTLPVFEKRLRQEFFGPNVIITTDQGDKKFSVFKACDAAVAVSGTVTLELAIAGIPHLLVYKMSRFSWMILQRIIKTPYAHLGNILLNSPKYHEYIQDCAHVDIIYPDILRLLREKNASEEGVRLSMCLQNLLTPPQGIKESDGSTVEFINSLVSGHCQNNFA